jgi:hypothetical protein
MMRLKFWPPLLCNESLAFNPKVFEDHLPIGWGVIWHDGEFKELTTWQLGKPWSTDILIKQNFNILMRGRKLRSDKANGVSEEW